MQWHFPLIWGVKVSVTHTHMYACTHAGTHTHTHTHTYKYIYIYIYMYVYVTTIIYISMIVVHNREQPNISSKCLIDQAQSMLENLPNPFVF